MATSLAALICIAILALVLWPILCRREVWDLDEGRGLLANLARRKDKLFRVIKDLEQERETGSLDEAEFVRLRNDYKQRAIQVMRELDRVRAVRLRRVSRGSGISAADRATVDRRVLEIRKARQKAGKSAATAKKGS